MRIIAVPMAQHMRALRAVGTLGYLPDALGKFLEKYKFLKFPTLATEFLLTDATKSIDFEHGKVEHNGRTIVIGRLQIWLNGISVITTTNTADSELALMDVLEWATEVFGIRFEELRPAANYSQLEVQFDERIDQGLSMMKEIGALIKDYLDDFYGFKPEYELTGLTFSIDPTAYPQIAPSPFKIEPRVGVPYPQKIYFSEAPMTTLKHRTILMRVEEILKQGRL